MTQLYIIRDTLAQAPSGPLVVLEHDAVAIRMFREILSDPNSMVARFAKDHELLCIGDFDRETCNVYTNGQPRVVISGEVLAAILEAEQAVTA